MQMPAVLATVHAAMHIMLGDMKASFMVQTRFDVLLVLARHRLPLASLSEHSVCVPTAYATMRATMHMPQCCTTVQADHNSLLTLIGQHS